MPKTIFIAATQFEADSLSQAIREQYPIIICGLGSTLAAISTIKAIEEHSAQLIVGFGIAGTIDNSLPLGTVVQVTSDYQADLGAFRHHPSPHFERFDTPMLLATHKLEGVIEVRGRTVSTACTPLLSDSGDQVESMEGAAVMAAAESCGVESLQLRAISNHITQPRGEWRIKEALTALSLVISKYF